jgi:outer membrane protein assembly factor BamB
MGNTGGNDTVWCFEADTGKVVWQTPYRCAPGTDGYPGPRATPAVDGKNVYTLSRDGILCCFDAATGNPRWTRQAGTRPPTWGYASSPVVLGNAVLLNVGGPGGAFNKGTGAPLWGGGGDAGYASVVPTDRTGKGTLLVFGGKALTGVSPGGRALWSLPWQTQHDVNAADPVVVNATTAFISSGYDHGCALVSFKGAPRVIWTNKSMRNHFSSCVLWKEGIFGFDDDALKCLDLKTGAVKWSQGGFGKGGLLLADGKLILLSEGGRLAVAEAATEGYKELAAAQVIRGRCWNAPVLANGRIYCRTSDGNVVCVDVSGK